MAETNKIKLQFGFKDDTNYTVELGPFAGDSGTINPDTLKQRIKSFDVATFGDNFVSEAGSECSAITAASIFKTKETEVYRNTN